MKDKWDTRSKEVINFIDNLLVVDPSKRMSASEALGHPWITEFKITCPALSEVENFIGTIRLANDYVPDVLI